MPGRVLPSKTTSNCWETAIQKGRGFATLMTTKRCILNEVRQLAEAAESPFTNPEDITSHGYAAKKCTFNDIKYFGAILRSLDATESSSAGFNSYHCVLYCLDQNSHNFQDAPVGPYFRLSSNVSTGVLFALESYSPKRMALLCDESDEPPIIPPLRHWSDMAFLHWKSTATKDADITSLRYIFRVPITNMQTLRVIDHILGDLAEELKTWPGVTIDADTEHGHALLGTPNGSGTARLLLQHKVDLGRTYIDRITLFHAEKPNDLFGRPTLLFHIRAQVDSRVHSTKL